MTEWCDLYKSGEPVRTILERVLVTHGLPEVLQQPLLGPLFVLLPGEQLYRIVLPALPDLPHPSSLSLLTPCLFSVAFWGFSCPHTLFSLTLKPCSLAHLNTSNPSRVFLPHKPSLDDFNLVSDPAWHLQLVFSKPLPC